MERREFLKLLGLTTATASLASGCVPEQYHWLGTPSRTVTSDVHFRKDGKIPGEAEYFPSACTECSGGCSTMVKVKNNHPIKLEGTPDHPINDGKLCTRGQVSIVRLYHPDRLKSPKARDENGKLVDISWKEAYSRISVALRDAKKDDKLSNYYLSGETSGTLAEAINVFCRDTGVEKLPEYEPISYSTLVEANAKVFGRKEIPHYNIEGSDYMLSLGADILETFVEPVSHGVQFGKAKDKEGWTWAHVEPHISLSGLKADERLNIAPGKELHLLTFLLKQVKEFAKNKISDDALKHLPSKSIKETAKETGISEEELAHIVEHLRKSKNPLVVSGGVAHNHETGLEVAILTALLQWSLGCVGDTIDFSKSIDYNHMGSEQTIKDLASNLNKGSVGVVFMARTNPVAFSNDLQGALKKAKYRVGLGDFMNATLDTCDIVLPLSHSIESLEEVQPCKGVYNVAQPVIKTMYNTRQEGEILLNLARVGGSYEEFIYDHWAAHEKKGNFSVKELLQKGFIDVSSTEKVAVNDPAEIIKSLDKAQLSPKGFSDNVLVVAPTANTYDGRSDVLDLLAEIPDALTTMTYGKWVSISRELATKMGLRDLDVVKLTAGKFSIERAVKIQPVLRGNIIMSHDLVGFAAGLTADKRTGQGGRYLNKVKVEKTGKRENIAIHGGNISADADRFINKQFPKNEVAHDSRALFPHSDHHHGPTHKTDGHKKDDHKGHDHKGHDHKGHDHKGHDHKGHDHKGGGGGNPKKDNGNDPFKRNTPNSKLTLYPRHDGKGRDGKNGDYQELEGDYPFPTMSKYKWAMAIDLDKCSGCTACITACYIENNVPVVGKKEHLLGREMSWLRLEPYVNKHGDKETIEFIPMLCQQCDNAPCESVCPVFATAHSNEGLNQQVYSRCVGTRYCANNCPYKVRRFNWFDHDWYHQLPLMNMANPDIMIRTKGIMEKCTFCVQRIRDAKSKAKDEGRMVRDGEITPACAQTCASGAIAFGNIKDKNSKVYKLSKSKDAHRILEGLNVEPNVYYLAKKKETKHEPKKHG